MAEPARGSHGVRRTIASTALVNVLIAGSAALGGVVIARYLGPTGRGYYATVFSWYIVIQAIAEVGLFGAATYFSARSDPQQVRTLVRRFRRLLLAQAIPLALVGLVLVLLVPLPDEVQLGFVVVLSLLPLVLAVSVPQFVLLGVDIRAWNLARTAQVPVYLGTLLLLALLGVLTSTLAICVFVSSALASGFLSAYLLSRGKGRGSFGAKTGEVAPPPRAIYRYGLANWAWILPTIYNGRVDQLVLSLTVPAAALGVYSVASSLVLMVYPAVAAIGNVVMPRLSALPASGEEAVGVRRRALTAAIALATILAGCIALAGQWLIVPVFGAGFASAQTIALLLAPAGAAVAVKQVAADVLRGSGKPGHAARVEIPTSVVLSVVLPLAAVEAGVNGVALSVSVIVCSSAVIMALVAYRLDWGAETRMLDAQ